MDKSKSEEFLNNIYTIAIESKNIESKKIESKKIESKNIESKNIEFNSEDIFINLRLISKIEVGDKLIQIDKHVNIDTSYFKSVTRWLNGSNRNDSIKFISMILYKAFILNDKLIEDKSDESIQKILRLNSDLKNSLNGLFNLKQTYSSDKLIQSEIDVMIDDIQLRIDTNLKNINFNKKY